MCGCFYFYSPSGMLVVALLAFAQKRSFVSVRLCSSAVKMQQNVEMGKHLVGLCVLILRFQCCGFRLVVLSFGPVLKYSIHLLCPLVFFNPKTHFFSICITLVDEDTAELYTETRPYQFTSFSVSPFTLILFTNDDVMPYKLSCMSFSIDVYQTQSSIQTVLYLQRHGQLQFPDP